MRHLRIDFFLLSVIIIHVLFFSYQIRHSNLYTRDSAEYLREAENIAQKGVFYCGHLQEPVNPEDFTRRTPGYPIFIFLTKAIYSKDLFVIFLQNLLSIFNILCLRKFIRGKTSSKTSAYILLSLIVLTPGQFIYSNLLMSEILLQTAIIAMFINLVSLFDDFETRKFFTLVLLCIISTLIKPVMALFAAIILLLGIFFWIRKKKTIILALSLTPLLFLFLFGLSNKQKTGYFEISSISTALLYNYNAYNTLQNVYGQAKADSLMSLSDSISSRFSTYKERSKFLRETSIQTILSNFPTYIELHLKGMAFIFLDPGRFDIYTFLNKEKTEGRGFLFHLSNDGLNGALTYLRTMDGLLITILIFFLLINCLKLLLLALSFFNNQIPPSIRAASIILIGYIAIIVGPSGCSRFMVPVVLIYNLMAAFQLLALRNKYKSIASR